MKKLLIAATLTAAAVAATPLLAQTGESGKPAQTAATEGCPMAGAAGNHEARQAQMQARMQAMHAGMGTHEGRGPRRGEHEGHGR